MATGRQLHFQHHQIQAEERDGQRTKGVCQFIPSHFTFFSVFYRVYLEAPPHNICLHHIGCNGPQPSLASPTLASPILAESNPKERWCSAATSIVSPANPLCQHWWGTMNSLRLKKKPCSYHRNISISVQCGYVTEKLLLIIWRKYWTSSEWLIGPHEEQGQANCQNSSTDFPKHAPRVWIFTKGTGTTLPGSLHQPLKSYKNFLLFPLGKKTPPLWKRD